ncbi:DUF2515 family protein [Metabacillus sp. 84]|uniref:DUF2515 family protein n=1 Tax=unclassified Metabacillus TaxID=2675274 RepID=UPI003CED4F4E
MRVIVLTMKQQSWVIAQVSRKTAYWNLDNISRTDAYFRFYKRHPEIKWPFLASMVSRNAGYNMTDLHSSCFAAALGSHLREELFLTYEAANWLIFSDAYPQLLIYEYSKYLGLPLFPLLEAFDISPFMVREWEKFWATRDQNRLMVSLIINEQHLIDVPVIGHPVFKTRVFTSFAYRFQDLFHFSTVLFPTRKGELYGFSVYRFKNIGSRINLGKKLARLLFDSRWNQAFYRFACSVPHTGSRYDYEQFFHEKRKRQTPMLRMVCPAVPHHIDEAKRKWFHGQNLSAYYKEPAMDHRAELTDWFRKKRNELQMISYVKEFMDKQKGAGR